MASAKRKASVTYKADHSVNIAGEGVCPDCKGSKIVTMDGQLVECLCVKRAKMRAFVQKYGAMQMPPEWIRKQIDKFHKDYGLDQNILFMFDPIIPLLQQNGAMGYALSKIYPISYMKLNIYELVEIRFDESSETGFTSIYQVDAPHVVLTCGQGELKNKLQEESLNRLLMKRLSDGKSTWVHSAIMRIDLVDFKRCMEVKCGFKTVIFDRAKEMLKGRI